ncbi:MAG: GDP-mannose 4,6-dehydratase [Planctomycetales bacterium]
MAAGPVALITGITGQDGSYLTELLQEKGYEIHGLIGSGSASRYEPGAGAVSPQPVYLRQVQMHYGDLSEDTEMVSLLRRVRPREIYHMAGQSDVRLSFDVPQLTAEVNILGTLRLMEAIRAYERETGEQIRFVQTTSSEMFGRTPQGPQNEQTPFAPCTPYACTRVYAYWQAVNYRESYGMFLCNGILFNHESPRRGEMFVTRKITKAAARIKVGLQNKLKLGNLDARRDWGFAGDYVRALWLMLQRDQADDYVIATGQQHTLQQLLELVFGHLGMDWREYVETDKRFLRPTEVGQLFGDNSKARRLLNWEPRVNFEELARMMTEHDLRLAERERLSGSKSA